MRSKKRKVNVKNNIKIKEKETIEIKSFGK